MSDSYDTNPEGHVSLMDKVKDKLHLGPHTAPHHTTTTSHHHTSHHTTGVDSRDLNRDGHISTGEKLASAPASYSSDALHDSGFNRGHLSKEDNLASTSSAFDSRDLNRDGHISTGEKLASAPASLSSDALHDSRFNRGHLSKEEKLASTGSAFDSRDLNRDGHISTGEKLASDLEDDQARLKLHEEQLAVSKRKVGDGEVDIHKRVQKEHVQETIPVKREEVTVERRALSGAADPNAQIASQDEIVRVPLYHEEIVTEKRLVPTEEVIVRKNEVMDNQTVGANLRSEYVETTQGDALKSHGFGDARDINKHGHVSKGEKLEADKPARG